MRKHILLVLVFTGLFSFGQSQTTTECSVQFETNSSILSPESKSTLEEWLASIGPKNIVSMSISGHTDSDGTDHYNQWLSKRRTESVKAFFDQRNIQSRMLELAPMGESAPIADNESESGKQNNRRVEILAEVTQPTYTEIGEKLGPVTQSFKASGNEPIQVIGKGGTEVLIPASALVNESGLVVIGEVDIELTEYLEKSDFLFGGLHTQSGDRLLETGGTVLVEAFSNGEKLKLAKGQKMDILFASRTAGDGMEIFNGVTSEDGVMDWSQAKQFGAVYEAVSLEDGFIRYTRTKDGVVESTVVREGPITNWKLDSLTMTEYHEQTEMTSLMMSSSKLGWINCDRFSPAEQNAELLVNVDTAYHPSVFLVFNDINSVMRGYYWDKEIKFQRIPSNKDVKVVALSYVNEQAYYAMQELTTDKIFEVELALAPISEYDLKKTLKRIN